MRTIKTAEITEAVAKLCKEAAYYLPEDVYDALKKGHETEKSPVGKDVLEQIIKNAEIAKAERKKKYYEQQEKILTRKVIPKLTRAERTNRLCTRAGMLESFLVHPELLSNDQVMDLLKIAFRQKEVNEALNEMLKTVTEEQV